MGRLGGREPGAGEVVVRPRVAAHGGEPEVVHELRGEEEAAMVERSCQSRGRARVGVYRQWEGDDRRTRVRELYEHRGAQAAFRRGP